MLPGYLKDSIVEGNAFTLHLTNHYSKTADEHTFSDFVEQCFDIDTEDTEGWDPVVKDDERPQCFGLASSLINIELRFEEN